MIFAKLMRSAVSFRHPLLYSLSLSLTSLVMLASPADAGDLTGLVIDANGDSAAEVTVQLSTTELISASTTVLSETETDGEGRFQISVPGRWHDTPRPWRQELALTVQTRSRGNGGLLIYREPPLPQHRLTIQLETWTNRKVSLQSAAGKPLAGKRVRLTNLQLPIVYPARYSQTPARQSAGIPDGALQSTGVSDDRGMAEMYLPPIESVGGIEAEIEKGVVVNWAVHSSNAAVPKDWSAKLRAPQLRRIPLQVSFLDGGPADLNLSVVSMPLVSDGPTIVARQDINLKPNGKATAIVQNNSMLTLKNTQDKPTEMHLQPSWFDKSTTLERLEVSFGKGVKVTGRAVSTAGEPAAKIGLFAMTGMKPLMLSTDAAGRFEFSAPAGALHLAPTGRSGYRAKNISARSAIIIPESAKTHDIGDIVFMRLKSLEGIVLDENKNPVRGAVVTAIWEESDPWTPQAINTQEERVVTSDDGAFAFPHLESNAELTLAAQCRGAATERLQTFQLEKVDGPVSLTVTRDAAIRVEGKVAAQNGSGIGGLEVTLRHRMKPPVSEAQLPLGKDVEGISLTTDRNGNYMTPKTLPPWGEYIAVVRSGTKREAVSGWKAARAGGAVALPTIEDSRNTELTGRVLAFNGAPLAEARVAVLTSDGQAQSQTGDDGTFAIDVPPGRMPLLIAEAEGFLSNGAAVEDGQAMIEIRLPKPGQLPPLSKTSTAGGAASPTPWSIERKRKLAAKLAEGFADADPQTKSRVDAALARHWPDRLLERMDSLPPVEKMVGQMIRSSLAMGLAEDRPEKGLKVLNALPDGPMKLHMLIQFERAAKLEADRRMELLARIVQDARGLRQADHRVAVMGFAGERLLDLGHRDSGEALLRESLKDARQLSPAAFSGYVRGAFAEELAQVDADKALKLIEPLTDNSEFNRHLKNIAHELAPIEPDRAIAVLDKMRPPAEGQRPLADEREQAALRVCYRMIRVAPDKAMRLGRSIEHASLRPYAFSLMAESLLRQEEVSDADRSLARRLHDEAWQMLAGVRPEQDLSEVAWLYPSTIAGLLLQQTVELAPRQTPYRVWQTIALRRPVEKSGAYRLAGLSCVCEMAVLLAEVDRKRAQQAARWLPDASSGANQFLPYVQYARSAAELIAALHPEECQTALEAIDDSQASQRLRLALLKALLRSGESRARAIRHNMALWFPDDEDLGPTE